jgi:hypothetical protein
METRLRKFKIRIVYFRDSGKFYSSTEVQQEFTDCGPDPEHPSCYMQEVKDWLKERRKEGDLPGLARGSKWPDGYIFLDCEDGFPCLLFPE